MVDGVTLRNCNRVAQQPTYIGHHGDFVRILRFFSFRKCVYLLRTHFGYIGDFLPTIIEGACATLIEMSVSAHIKLNAQVVLGSCGADDMHVFTPA
jgi:hypothetical protein